MTKLQQLADELYGAFESRERPDGTPFIALREDAQERWGGVVRDAHASVNSLLPHDWVYSAIRNVAVTIEAGDGVEMLDPGISAYELCEWAKDFMSWANERIDEAGGDDILTMLQLGQLSMLEVIYSSVLHSLEDMLEDNDDATQ